VTRTRPARKARGAYHHGNLRRALLDAALELVEREGVAGLTLREAARRAGVSQAAPYRHFADKEALLAAVAEEGFTALAAEMRQRRDAQQDPLLRFRELGLAYVSVAVAHPSHFRVMFGRQTAARARHPGLRRAADETFALLVDGIVACQHAGQVRHGDPRQLALAAWSIVHGLAALVVDGQLVDRSLLTNDELAEAVTRDLFLGLGPRDA
jgi:AcrR family transcriptional regulator